MSLQAWWDVAMKASLIAKVAIDEIGEMEKPKRAER